MMPETLSRTQDAGPRGSDLLAIDSRDLRTSAASGLAHRLQGTRLASRALRLAVRLEGGRFYSATLRRVLLRRHDLYVGAYSYGPFLRPGAWPGGITIGRFVSVADGVKVFRRNHPTERLSMHPFFYNSALGFVASDTIAAADLEIGADAWIGENSLILPGCRRIGIGAVLGAGSVVTRDVPDLAIVGGNPARVLRMRFDEPVAQAVLASRWWERSIGDIAPVIDSMTAALDMESLTSHPLLGSGLQRR